MTKDEVLKLALEALEYEAEKGNDDAYRKEREAIKEALAQPEQEPVAWLNPYGGVIQKRITGHERNNFTIPLYTTPPQRKPLTDEEIDKLPWEPHEGNPMTFAEGLRYFARAIEAAHGIWPENSDCYGPDWTDRDGEYLK